MSLKPEEAAAIGNSNFHLKGPVVRLPSRGLELALDLTYNSRLRHKAGNKFNFDVDADWLAPGWSFRLAVSLRLSSSTPTHPPAVYGHAKVR